MHCLCQAVSVNALDAPFAANAALFVAGEEDLRRGLGEGIDKHIAGLDLRCDLLGVFDVFCEDTGTETNVTGQRDIEGVVPKYQVVSGSPSIIG